ncbi:hypothetical protein P153DRAFT_416303 [Dothidotthia symphoricarpi CBS 119687]|uniref:Uncharacterized protein n=1 Tax=Dothidotthia symphoricarpi CBS 119687 TaxID=1392245 RepID=A0A6A6AHE3_9PLEO|nr:uncharacterized protein P153DRAFT_416303 [Dothidotthia symphoricarpi CBS 119687]KAF2131369.1 hypothetical protein P153DRAFT_416303 [Dothidotthia symphoricarpi CBS 119687]
MATAIRSVLNKIMSLCGIVKEYASMLDYDFMASVKSSDYAVVDILDMSRHTGTSMNKADGEKMLNVQSCIVSDIGDMSDIIVAEMKRDGSLVYIDMFCVAGVVMSRSRSYAARRRDSDDFVPDVEEAEPENNFDELSKHSPNNADIVKKDMMIAIGDLSLNTVLFDITNMSFASRTRAYEMTQSLASTTRKVIVTFGSGRLQERRRMYLLDLSYIAIDPETAFERTTKSLS